MSYRMLGMALVLTSLSTVGCGTAVNLVRHGSEGGKVPFGGVQHDLDTFHETQAAAPTTAMGDTTTLTHFVNLGRRIFFVVDLPLSLIADTITWPYTSAYTFINEPVALPPILQAPPDGLLATPLVTR